MARKGSLIAAMKATSDQIAAEAAQPAVVVLEQDNPVLHVPGLKALVDRQLEMDNPRARVPGAAMVTTAIHIPKETHDLLRRVAVERAVDQGGRPSVSAVLTELVQRHWAELAGEAKR